MEDKLRELRKLIRQYDYSGDDNIKTEIESFDTSSMDDLSGLFRDMRNISDIDLSGWDVSNVTNMSSMFYNSSFNGNVSNWNMSNIESAYAMFCYADNFNQDVSNWNTSSLKDATRMFREAKAFNQDISNWNVRKVEIANEMFMGTKAFNQDLKKWFMPKLVSAKSFNAGSGISYDKLPLAVRDII